MPQEGVTSTSLFLAHINDLVTGVPAWAKYAFHADDLVLLCTNEQIPVVKYWTEPEKMERNSKNRLTGTCSRAMRQNKRTFGQHTTEGEKNQVPLVAMRWNAEGINSYHAGHNKKTGLGSFLIEKRHSWRKHVLKKEVILCWDLISKTEYLLLLKITFMHKRGRNTRVVMSVSSTWRWKTRNWNFLTTTVQMTDPASQSAQVPTIRCMTVETLNGHSKSWGWLLPHIQTCERTKPGKMSTLNF